MTGQPQARPPPEAAGGETRSAGEVVRIQTRSVGHVFNSLDPSPFRERDIDAEVERYIVDWVRELPREAHFQIVVELPPGEAGSVEAATLPEALANYFADRAARCDVELRELFRIGWRVLLIGTAVLVASLTASQTLVQMIPSATLRRVLEESMILLGWVANWRPIEIYLYDWWPIVRRRRLYRRIAAAPIFVEAH
ncbi:hypothetical protein BH10PSE9_BH10PSE9_25340 [soil metagenome]